MAIFVVLAFILQGQVSLLLAKVISERLVTYPLSWLLASLPLVLLLPRPAGVGPFSGIAMGLGKRHRVYFSGGLAAGAVMSGGIVLVQQLGGWVTFSDAGKQVPWAQEGVVVTFALSIGVFSAAAAGEELLLRGYGFQQLSRCLSPVGAACAAGLMFGFMHAKNPNVTGLAVLNTAEFGLVFGLALARHRSLWLPLGMHLGWNLMLAALGVRISGLTISIFGFASTPHGSALWSGGRYGPEASLFTTASVALALWIVWRAPVLEDTDRLIWDDPDSQIDEQCESPSTLLPSPSPVASSLTQASTTLDAKNSSAT